jgi:hypothetical protein
MSKVTFKSFIHPYPAGHDGRDAADNPLPELPVQTPSKEQETQRLPLDAELSKIFGEEFHGCPFDDFKKLPSACYGPGDLSPAPSISEIMGGMASACAIGVLIGYLAFSKPAVCTA